MFSGFNLVVGDTSGLFYASNRFINPHYQAKPIEPGVWGLSNALFNTPWPKVLCTQGLVAAYLMQCQTLNVVPTTQQLAHIMRDTTPVPDAQLPQTGLPLERERQLATPFIVGEHYGTRCTSVIMQHRDGSIRFEEQSYLPCQTQPSATVSWQVDQPLSGKGWVRLKVN